jgi:integrase
MPQIDPSELIRSANARLKSARVGVAIQTRGDRLSLVATLPPKDKRERRPPFQQRIPLGLVANRDGVKRSEEFARKLGAQLALKEFKWEQWIAERRRETIGDYVQALEREFWRRHDEATPAHHETWRVGYWSVLKTLPMDRPLTIELLENWVPKRRATVSRREHYVTCAKWLARLADLPLDLPTEHRSQPTTKRSLPPDEAIVLAYDSIVNPAHKWVLGMMAAYGLRDHEIFGLDLSQYPDIMVRSSAKTGRRIIIPLWPGEAWDLAVECLPDNWAKAIAEQNWDKPSISNSKLGEKVTRIFSEWENGPHLKRKRVKRWSFGPYDLRHCYAQRAKSLGLDDFESAKLMGHSVRVHTKTYQFSIPDSFYVDIAKRKLGRID